MKTKFGLFSLLASLGKDERASSRRLLGRLLRDEAGSYLLYLTLLIPVLIGIAGLGTEGGLILYTHQTLQAAADSAALSAARAYSLNPSMTLATTQADAITATYGFVDGTNGAKVKVNGPPTSGSYTGYTCSFYPCAIEVIVTQQEVPLLSSLWLSKLINNSARAIAIAPPENCVLALGSGNPSGAVTVALLAGITLNGCGLFTNSKSNSSIEVDFFAEISASTVGTVGKYQDFLGSITPTPTTGDNPICDPYGAGPCGANVSIPPSAVPPAASCQYGTSTTPKKGYSKPPGPITIIPGVYCQGMQFTGNTVTMNPGVYYLYGGSLTMVASTLTGTGVTLVFTGSSGTGYVNNLNVDGFSQINLTAPLASSGLWSAGIVMYGDRSMPVTSFDFSILASFAPQGVVYLPTVNLKFAGLAVSSGSCTNFVVNTLTVAGIAALYDNCGSFGTKSISASAPTLVD